RSDALVRVPLRPSSGCARDGRGDAQQHPGAGRQHPAAVHFTLRIHPKISFLQCLSAPGLLPRPEVVTAKRRKVTDQAPPAPQCWGERGWATTGAVHAPFPAQHSPPSMGGPGGPDQLRQKNAKTRKKRKREKRIKPPRTRRGTEGGIRQDRNEAGRA